MSVYVCVYIYYIYGHLQCLAEPPDTRSATLLQLPMHFPCPCTAQGAKRSIMREIYSGINYKPLPGLFY